MKTIANRLAVFAVSTVVLGTMAYGESAAMEARVPFAFQTARGTMPAGKYTVYNNFNGVRGVLALQNTASKQWAVAMGVTSYYADSGTNGVLSFRCDDGCALVGVQTRNNVIAFSPRKTSRNRETAVITVPLTNVPLTAAGGN